MGYLDKVVAPKNSQMTTGGTSSGGYLSRVTPPKDLERSKQIFGIIQESKKLEAESKKLNSFGGLVKGTIKAIPSTIANSKFGQTTKEAAKDFQEGNYVKGVLKAGGRNAGDFAIEVFKPISYVIGKALQLTGGQKLVDKAGEVIADSTGITDNEKFQKFAMEHPNAGEDFDRILNLGLLGKAGKEKINPKALTAEIQTFSNKIIQSAKPISVKEINKKLSTLEPATETFFDKVTLPETTAKPNVSKTSLKIQEQAKTEGIDASFADVPPIERMRLAEEGVRARDLISRDPETALKSIETDTRAPGQPRAESVFIELKKKALEEGDVDMIQQLAKSKIGTEAAQSLKALDDGLRLEADPVSSLKEIRAIKEQSVAKKLKTDNLEKVKSSEKAKVEKVRKVEKQTWEEFINSIEC